MRIVVDVNHPGHVHLFRNFIKAMKIKGHDVLVTASEKDVTFELLHLYHIEYVNLGSYGKSPFEKMLNIPILDYRMYKAAKEFNPDIFLGVGSIRASHIASLMGKPSIAFEDTEHCKEQHLLYVPFTSKILTPSCFKKEFGKKQIRYNGYHELAYLHPNYFTPNPEILDDIGLKKDDVFIILRLVSWEASHDIGQSGVINNIKFVNELEKCGNVIITSEAKLSPELEKYRVKISPERLHDLLYYSSLYIGEGGTTASESATLGTHAIHISTTAKHCGVFDELHKYGLMWTFDDEIGSIELVKELLTNPDLWKLGKEKRRLLLKEQINVTDFMIWLLEDYPESLSLIKQTPSFLDRFASGDFL